MDSTETWLPDNTNKPREVRPEVHSLDMAPRCALFHMKGLACHGSDRHHGRLTESCPRTAVNRRALVSRLVRALVPMSAPGSGRFTDGRFRCRCLGLLHQLQEFFDLFHTLRLGFYVADLEPNFASVVGVKPCPDACGERGAADRRKFDKVVHDTEFGTGRRRRSPAGQEQPALTSAFTAS